MNGIRSTVQALAMGNIRTYTRGSDSQKYKHREKKYQKSLFHD
jgi:hypothetical protein